MPMPSAAQHPVPLGALENATEFLPRHIGIDADDQARMLSVIGETSRRALIDSIVPRSIARRQAMELPLPVSEAAALAELRALAARNQVLRSFIGQGYYGTHTPGVILRNILENPAWYTAYTPYQAEISQGRMEALVNFQTMVCDLTGMPIANASMLDEATAAAEAMMLAKRSVPSGSQRFIVAGDTHPQTIEVIQTRAGPLGIEVVRTEGAAQWQAALAGDYFAVLAQYPASSGRIDDLRADVQQVQARQAAFIVAADLLALTLITAPGEWGADIVVGSSQRFGMPMGAGGPHAAYMACRDEFKRSLPGRLVGVSRDAHGRPAYRLALQTREQHIRREKATSNICTAQVLPAVIASMYAVYHGPAGLERIARRVACYTAILARGLAQLGVPVRPQACFDTLLIATGDVTRFIAAKAVKMGANLRLYDEKSLCIALDETTTRGDIELLWKVFSSDDQAQPCLETFENGIAPLIPAGLQRRSRYLTHPVFNTHHSETGMLRYIRQLSDKDLALDRSMIPLGSCTMKLNATSEMIPITWPGFADLHPFAPADQLQGYRALDAQLCAWLCQATGYAGISLQPNAGSQGEYAGLLAIRAYHQARGQGQRNICLIPSSAHGTNPASARMAGLQVVVSACDANGNVDLADLEARCERHSAELAAVMITYPSTHGVFETGVKELCALVHRHGGLVYVDGANMNALVGVAAPGEFGGDVSHLNLHKTFCIPHGGGGPGVGPVCVVQDLVPYLPGHATTGTAGGVGAVSAAPLGNAAVLPISWMYCRMMGAEGLQAATETAIVSANYISARLKEHYPTLYASANGHVAHECILDLRSLKDSSGVLAEDVAKRLIDYGFHAPTLSFPVPNTLMVEPTESETLFELDRFIAAMIAIRQEIRQIEIGLWPRDDNPLKNAPHTAESLLASAWDRPYTRAVAAYPVASLRSNKYWPPVGRVDNVWGDRNLSCSCIPVADAVSDVA
ncbi:aminomethyl-transferring glycine dehydrogenase [Verminephrobacter eiseniae]|uniref:Glycine dehydrogenase (decarboxylating) n=1 Tax=Verminephrobacter eiseniae (strain EF01-2) TaxID=391735 RepID=A1WPV9_VEREI|nr:aminomethyl-transferring glycine dehydrogenase [Verminephrobacter eiseniae]ABM59666.1 glycine dehydrogenase [Verminephrobacter eiseniae EF01-2]MCW5285182.1 glycine dehydrogenase (aminomethyl-transferring) [Verminephrobacter eiseniae]MCW5302890.1 glycine dehydrogenase (aminomethyl-transferring) [Verminephrobacter eiseniae]MCW8179841.1 glycine dehydrogenase (aminomethyl-transferring) [Verminephrobacter eiseniae]MCW8190937.1 glycine dehydrogenase (aminomethyl-transferring) [Verminephrobacter e